jgi:16S rRNA (guanine527-N7)-methyltransferase
VVTPLTRVLALSLNSSVSKFEAKLKEREANREDATERRLVAEQQAQIYFQVYDAVMESLDNNDARKQKVAQAGGPGMRREYTSNHLRCPTRSFVRPSILKLLVSTTCHLATCPSCAPRLHRPAPPTRHLTCDTAPAMDAARIAKLLAPFLAIRLAPTQLQNISTYIDLLLRWNQKLNLTAVRDPEHIVTRHFGESLFAAQHLFAAPQAEPRPHLADVGSGPGFPGLPIKIFCPQLRVTLIESHHKKATFLREVIRALTLTDIDVFTGRAQDFPPSCCDLVTLRAVERFEHVLPVAARLVRPRARIALLLGQSQVSRASELLPSFTWRDPVAIPLSSARVLLQGVAPALW